MITVVSLGIESVNTLSPSVTDVRVKVVSLVDSILIIGLNSRLRSAESTTTLICSALPYIGDVLIISSVHANGEFVLNVQVSPIISPKNIYG